MSNIQTGAERMPHDLSHLGFLAGQIGRLITISTTPVIDVDSFKMDAVGDLRLSPLRRGLSIDSTEDIFTFYFLHYNIYDEQLLNLIIFFVNDITSLKLLTNTICTDSCSSFPFAPIQAPLELPLSPPFPPVLFLLAPPLPLLIQP